MNPSRPSRRPPVAYVHGIVLKTFLSNRRRRSSGEIPVDATPDRPSRDRDPTERLALMAALRTLPPLDRAVVVLRYWEDRSVEETGHALHLSPAAVKNRSLRALARLRLTLTIELHELASTKAPHDSH